MKRRRHKVAVRRSHRTYRWRTLAETFGAALRALLLTGSAAALAWGAHRAWTRAPGLAVQDVVFDTPVPPGFREAFPVKRGDPLFGFSRRRWEKRLASQFSLAEVRVERSGDRAVHVAAVPRRPVAKMGTDGQWRGVDAGGHLFPLTGPGESLVILAVPPADVAPALAFLRALRETKERWTESLYKIKMSSDGETALFLAGDTAVYWGAPAGETVPAKARRVSRVLAAPEGAGGYEHLRFVDDRRVAAKPRPAPAAPPPGPKQPGTQGKKSSGP